MIRPVFNKDATHLTSKNIECAITSCCKRYVTRAIGRGGCLFFLKGVSEVSIEAAETARRILALRESHRSAIADNLGRAAGNGHRVLQHLYQRPMVSVNDVRDLIETTYPAANQLVDRMVQCGILMEITGQSRNRLFQYESYIRLFDEQHHQPNA